MSLYDRLVPADALRWPTRCDAFHPTLRYRCDLPARDFRRHDHWSDVVDPAGVRAELDRICESAGLLPWRKRR